MAKETSSTDGTITHIYTDEGDHITECDEDFRNEMDAEDESETIRRTKNPVAKRMLKRFRMF